MIELIAGSHIKGRMPMVQPPAHTRILLHPCTTMPLQTMAMVHLALHHRQRQEVAKEGAFVDIFFRESASEGLTAIFRTVTATRVVAIIIRVSLLLRLRRPTIQIRVCLLPLMAAMCADTSYRANARGGQNAGSHMGRLQLRDMDRLQLRDMDMVKLQATVQLQDMDRLRCTHHLRCMTPTRLTMVHMDLRMGLPMLPMDLPMLPMVLQEEKEEEKEQHVQTLVVTSCRASAQLAHSAGFRMTEMDRCSKSLRGSAHLAAGLADTSWRGGASVGLSVASRTVMKAMSLQKRLWQSTWFSRWLR